MHRALILIAAVLLACGKRPAPQPREDEKPKPGSLRPPHDDTCTTTDDCAVLTTFISDDCCDRCGSRIVNKSSKARTEAYCRAHPSPIQHESGAYCDPKPAECSDPTQYMTLECKDGHCREYIPPPPPPVGGTCATTADCARTSIGEDCCLHCEQRIGSKAAIAELKKKCDVEIDAGRAKCHGVVCSTFVSEPYCNLTTHQCE